MDYSVAKIHSIKTDDVKHVTSYLWQWHPINHLWECESEMQLM